MASLHERLSRGEVVILDGATSTELERKGLSNATNAWSALANLEHPDVVREVHREYIEVGADVITTNTFATSRLALEAAGMGDRAQEINARAVGIAKEARERAPKERDVAIAGSISHFLGWGRDAEGVFVRRGKPDAQRLKANFQEQAEVLAKAGCDLLLLEMMRDVEMATYAMKAAVSTGLPVWVGYACLVDEEGTNVRIGERGHHEDNPPFKDALEQLLPQGGSLMAAMHMTVHEITPALDVLRESWSGPIGAYAHSGAMDSGNWQFDEVISAEEYLREAQGWVRMGVQLVGACCGMGPEHIRLLREHLPHRVS